MSDSTDELTCSGSFPCLDKVCVCVCVCIIQQCELFLQTLCAAGAGAVNKRLNLAKLGYKHVSTPATQQQHADNNIVMTTTTTTTQA